jgi:hypothetical protein
MPAQTHVCFDTSSFIGRWSEYTGYTGTAVCYLRPTLCAASCRPLSNSAAVCSASAHTDRQCVTNSVLTAPDTCVSSPSCLTSLQDQAALSTWKLSVTDPSGRLASWQGPNPCSRTQPWAGVVCSDDGFAVTGLMLSGFNLSGPLPPAEGTSQLMVRCTGGKGVAVGHTEDVVKP